MEHNQLELDLADALMERPNGFNVGHRHFFLYPPTLGKIQLLSRIIESLEIDSQRMVEEPLMELTSVTMRRKKDVARVIAYHTARTKQEVLNNSLMTKRAEYLEQELSDEDMATLLVMAMANDKYNLFVKHLGIDKEQERFERIRKVKEGGNVYTFGGKSVYGTLIDFACERYGWTLDYVVWGISYVNLRLLMADSVKSLTLTDDEKKRVHLEANEDVINADSKDSMSRILEMDWS